MRVPFGAGRWSQLLSAAQWSIWRRRDRHIAHWHSVKFMTLVFAGGKTMILTHEKKEAE